MAQDSERPGRQDEPALGPGGVPLEPAGASAAGRPQGLLDYYLGTREGRSRLMVMILVLSLLFTGIGYGLIFWIFMRGGI